MRCPSLRKHGLELSWDGSPCESRGRSAGRRARPVWRAAAQQTSCAEGANLSLRCAAHGWHAPFGASPPFLCRRQTCFLRVVVGRARADRRRENRVVCASLRAPAKQSRGFRKRLDCFVAVAPRHDAIKGDFHPAHSAPGYSLRAIPPPTPRSCRSRMVPTRKRARCPWAFA
jgi:hypothetical protein